MTSEQAKLCAAFILRSLLETDAPKEKPASVEWGDLLDIARRNTVLLRLAERLEEGGARPPEFFRATVEEERRLNRAKLELICRTGRACEKSNVEFIFAKAFHHYPDMGGDVDLFVADHSCEVDEKILGGMKAEPCSRRWIDRLAAASCYCVQGYEAKLEIHHGRMSAYGEHNSFVSLLIRNALPTEIEGKRFLMPSPEDLIVMQATQRVYGRRYIRLAPILYTIASVRRDGLDWDYTLATARRFGAHLALSCYLTYIEQIHQQVFGRELLPANLKESLIMDGWGRIESKNGLYCFPHLRVARKVYANTLRRAMLAGNSRAFGRLCLLPFVAATAMLRKSVS